MNSRYKHLTSVASHELPSYVPRVEAANEALGFACFETAPLWLAVNETLRARGCDSVGHLLRAPNDTFLVLAWDSDCHEKERVKSYWYDYAILFPLVTDPELLGQSVVSYASDLLPFMEMSGKAQIAQHVTWRRLYQELEFIYPTRGLIALQDPATENLSLPMRKRRRACAKFHDASRYVIRDLDDVEDDVLCEVLSAWLAHKAQQDDEVETSGEYTLFAQRASRAELSASGVVSRGLALTEKESGRCLGFTYATRVSPSLWAFAARIHLRGGSGVPSYVGEFLWREEARHWQSVPWETDGSAAEDDGVDGLGLSAQKTITLRALLPQGAYVQEQVGLTGSSIAQGRRFLPYRNARHALLTELRACGLELPFPLP